MPLLEIIPKDSLLFRDGKPFSAGSDHFAESIFPPKPSVFAGFIRSKIFIDNWQGDENKTWEEVKDYIGQKNDNYGKLQIKAVFIKSEDKYYLTTPLNIVKEKRKDEEKKENIKKEIKYLIPLENKNSYYSTNIGLSKLAFVPKEIEFAENVGGFISLDGLIKYLSAENISETDIKNKNDFVLSEPRVGISVDSKTNTVKESHLYSVEFLRFKENCGFAVLYDGVDFNWEGDYFLGGEKRQVSCFVNENFKLQSFDDIFKKIKESSKFKVLLISPLEIKDSEIEPSVLKSKLNGIGEFITAVTKTELIGGWDIALGKPKPIKKYYSAGSVFYYQLKDENKVDELKKLNFETISEKEGQIGYGRILIGTW